jgi:hypothetical protein
MKRVTLSVPSVIPIAALWFLPPIQAPTMALAKGCSTGENDPDH